MAQRKTSFQNPATGVDCVVRYFFGKLFVKPYTSGGHWSQVDDDVKQETIDWCDKHHKQTFSTVDKAADYIAKHFGPDGPCTANVIRDGF